MRRDDEETARAVVYNNETHLEVAPDRELTVGDVLPAYRGNGPREGERVGWAVVRGVNPGSAPELDLHLGSARPSGEG
jgi:hypothetical protein